MQRDSSTPLGMTIHLISDLRYVSRFVSCHECLPKLIERSALNFRASSTHQVQIRMQIVHGNQAKPEDFFRLVQMTNVAAREFRAGGTRAVFFDRPFVQRELRVF